MILLLLVIVIIASRWSIRGRLTKAVYSAIMLTAIVWGTLDWFINYR